MRQPYLAHACAHRKYETSAIQGLLRKEKHVTKIRESHYIVERKTCYQVMLGDIPVFLVICVFDLNRYSRLLFQRCTGVPVYSMRTLNHEVHNAHA